MGTDKALLPVGGMTMLEHLVQCASALCLPVWVVGRERPSAWPPETACFVPDLHPGEGPLGGLLTAFASARGFDILLLPCDLPLMTGSALEWLAAEHRRFPGEVVLPSILGSPSPLPGIYPSELECRFPSVFASGTRSLLRAVRETGFPLRQPPVPDDVAAAFEGANTPAEWQSALARSSSTGWA